MEVTKLPISRNELYVVPQKVIVLYTKIEQSSEEFLSRSGHVKPRLNLRRPFRKAKYSLITDSEPVERSKDEKNPDEGELNSSETMCLQAVGARLNV